MTEKRFKVTDNTNNPFLCDWSVTDYADGGIVSHPMTSENMANVICDLLNELNDTNQELYDFRLVLNALLFNEWAENKKYEVYKSKRHSDGKLCFDGEWFVVVAILPTGQVTNHYHVKYWDYFKIPSYEKVKDEFDGHTSTDVLIRYGLMFND